MKAVDLVVMGIEVEADSGCQPGVAMVAMGIHEMISNGPQPEPETLRDVLRVMRDAALGAVDVHEGAPDVEPVTLGRMRRFAAAMTAALKEIS